MLPLTSALNSFQDASENLAKFWQQIPDQVDVLITHGPPKGYGDRILLGAHVGCPELMKRVREINCRYHLFGHIHEVSAANRGLRRKH